MQKFVEIVSLPGNARLQSTSKARRYFWLATLVCAFILLSCQLVLVVLEYREYKLNTVVRNRPNQFQFPDVTICKLRPYSRAKQSREDLGLENATRFWKYALEFSQNISDPNNFIAQYLAVMSSWEYISDKDIYVDIKDHIHLCMYSFADCMHKNFNPTRQPLSSNCVTFSPDNPELSKPKRDFGLHFVLSMGGGFNSVKLNNKITPDEGYEIYIHERGSQVPIDDLSIFADPWTDSSISLTMKKYRKKSTPRDRCGSNDDLRRAYEKAAAKLVVLLDECHTDVSIYERDCAEVLTQVIANYFCKCIPQNGLLHCKGLHNNSQYYERKCEHLPKHYFYNDGISSNGTLFYAGTAFYLHEEVAFKQIIDRLDCTLNTYPKIRKKIWTKDVIKRCPKRCNKLVYDIQLASTNWPSSKLGLRQYFRKITKEAIHINSLYGRGNKTLPNNNRFTEDDNESFARVTISASDLSVDEVQEYLEYPLSKVISDFGGTIGLWLGYSFLNLAELVDYVVYILGKRLCSSKTQTPKTEATKDSNSPETISRDPLAEEV